ncbi:MAG: CPBP family intramembrane metalloprotease [Acidobacteria bacterium]|nr:CPBP family intramembrane metalloprotease [Acidobacteriota bacterium]
MPVSSIFFGPDGVLRSGWRFAVFSALFIVAWVIVTVSAFALASPFGIETGAGSATFLLINGVFTTAAALLIGWLCARTFERLPFSSLGASFSSGWLQNLAIGSLLGAATLSLAIGIAWAFGGVSFAMNQAGASAILQTLALTFAVFFAAGAAEEALFRGYIFQTFDRSRLTLFAIVLTSLLFATVHNANPNASVFSWSNTFLAGIWFAVAYLRTRDLWFATGLHVMWNWMQGAFFGIEVSGLKELIPAPFLVKADAGPVWLTGGDYGLEGGIACTVALLFSTALIWFVPGLKRSGS